MLEDRALAFDLGSLAPAERPLAWDEAKGAKFAEMFPAATAEVALVIPDEQGIEHPLCLSNFGRRADGSYVIGGGL